MAIREVLEEELGKLPQGSLVQKRIKGHLYYYLVLRDEDRQVKLIYKGKVEPEEVVLYASIKQQRAQYRNLRSKVRGQIRFLRRALNAKAAV